MKQSHDLGQVFLKDTHYIQKIVDSLPCENAAVLEIGPGDGEISDRISRKAKILRCVELDSRYYNKLTQKFNDKTNIKIIHGDILKFDFKALTEKPLVFGMVPYQISTQLMYHLVANRFLMHDVYLTLQKEFVQRLIAEPGQTGYGYLTCFMQYYARIEKIFDIPKTAFKPVPKIDSSYLRMRFFEKPTLRVTDENTLFEIIKKAFSQRRKKVINSLQFLSKNKEFFIELGINANLRAENLSLQNYITIANHLTHQA